MPTYDNPMPPYDHEYPKPKKEVSQRAAELGLQPIAVQCLEPDAERDDPPAGVVFLAYVYFSPRIGERIVIEDGGVFEVQRVYHRVARPEDDDLTTMMPNVVAVRCV